MADHLASLKASIEEDRRQKADDKSVVSRPPSVVWPLQRDVLAFYGNPRGPGTWSHKWWAENIVSVACPWPLSSDGGRTHLSHISIHKKCAASLTRVLARVWQDAGCDITKIRALKYDVFSGSLAYRNKRGSSSMSMHTPGCAIDFDAPDNQMHAQKHLFTDESLLVRAFKSEGWIWGGDWAGDGVDAMHFQAARVHT
ncbi:MAG: M15 family metallopeptidase [Methylocystis sp.]|nr:M15 family metallopeptidase [Methylocystis sp.]